MTISCACERAIARHRHRRGARRSPFRLCLRVKVMTFLPDGYDVAFPFSALRVRLHSEIGAADEIGVCQRTRGHRQHRPGHWPDDAGGRHIEAGRVLLDQRIVVPCRLISPSRSNTSSASTGDKPSDGSSSVTLREIHHRAADREHLLLAADSVRRPGDAARQPREQLIDRGDDGNRQRCTGAPRRKLTPRFSSTVRWRDAAAFRHVRNAARAI